MNMQRLNRSGSRKRHSYRKASILVSCLLFSLTMWGCSALFLVPVTLKEVKDSCINERYGRTSEFRCGDVESYAYAQQDYHKKRSPVFFV